MPIKSTCVQGVAAIPIESSVVRTSQEGAGYTFNSAGGAYCHGVARPFEDNIRVAEIYLEMREINPNVLIRAVSLAASVGKKIATKVVSKVKGGALIDPRLQVRYCAQGAGLLTILYKDDLLVLALWAKNNQMMLKAYSRCLYLATGKFVLIFFPPPLPMLLVILILAAHWNWSRQGGGGFSSTSTTQLLSSCHSWIRLRRAWLLMTTLVGRTAPVSGLVLLLTSQRLILACS